MQRALTVLLSIVLLTVGCIGSQTPAADDLEDNTATEIVDPGIIDLDVDVDPALNFSTNVVDAAIGYTNDLYEPTMEVSDNGVIYVTGHTILVDTTGAPVFMSHDDGESWEQLPFWGETTMPAGIHGATPPPSDEIFLTAGEDGWLYGVDITAATFPVNAWANDGGEHAYHNPNAYDRAESTSAGECSAASLNDRPWGSAANGKLLMVNNPGGGPMQIGVMDVPPDTQADVPGNPATGPEWNTCASTGGYIPGIPDMREDHFFAVPQTEEGKLHVVTGNASDVNDVQQRHVFNVTNTGGGTSNYGQVVFDDEGDMFVGIRNNTEEDADGNRTGQLKIATSTDDGETFTTRTFRVGSPTTSIYMDGNMAGPGALLTWAQDGDDATDWYAAHLTIGDEGQPVVSNVSLALDEGPPPSAHVQGAALGPDGRSYMVMFNGGYTPVDRATPIDVLVQQDGPTMPVETPVDAAS